MKRTTLKNLCLIFAILLCAFLVACDETEEGHVHEWVDSTCSAPKTCSLCGETQGDVQAHLWIEATCQKPKTCEACAETEGDVASHTWLDATCEKPKTCKFCAATEGSVGAHVWGNATCTQPSKCTKCGATSGKEKGHSWEKATCTSPKRCKTCNETSGSALSHTYNTSGKCKTCGYKDPNFTSEVKVWIPTKGGKKYHSRAGCSNMIDPKEVTKSQAIKQGFTACGRCY